MPGTNPLFNLAHEPWLALMIGNSRLHWAWFEGEALRQRWDGPHLAAEQAAQLRQELEQGCFSLPNPHDRVRLPPACPLWLASVVPHQTALWQSSRAVRPIALGQIPLGGLYSTLGIDRALALLGAATVYGLPSLVIDAGTALTITGADAAGRLMGGAILPGLRLQLRSLAHQTADLPDLAETAPVLPARWATDTPSAIWSGVLYALLAGLRDFITDWRQQFPDSSIQITGGDAVLLHELLIRQLIRQSPKLAEQTTVDANLIFWGMRAMRARQQK